MDHTTYAVWLVVLRSRSSTSELACLARVNRQLHQAAHTRQRQLRSCSTDIWRHLFAWLADVDLARAAQACQRWLHDARTLLAKRKPSRTQLVPWVPTWKRAPWTWGVYAGSFEGNRLPPTWQDSLNSVSRRMVIFSFHHRRVKKRSKSME